MKKIVAIFLTCLITLPTFAVGELAVWDELRGDRNSSPSDFGVILLLIIGLIAGAFLFKSVISGDDNKEDKGCIITFLIGIMIVGVISAIALVSK